MREAACANISLCIFYGCVCFFTDFTLFFGISYNHICSSLPSDPPSLPFLPLPSLFTDFELACPRGQRIVRLEAEYAKATRLKDQTIAKLDEQGSGPSNGVNSTDDQSNDLLDAAIAASEPCTRDELAAAKAQLIGRLNQSVIRLCIRKFRKKFPPMTTTSSSRKQGE